MSGARKAGETVASRYRIVETLGSGGFAHTYAAAEIASGRRVALKELALRGAPNWKAVDVFEREARILRSLHHPGVPAYADSLREESSKGVYFYLVQELAEGRSLAARLAAGQRFGEAEATSVAEQVLEILVYLHGLSPPVVHRDIKPQNIIQRNDGRCALVDFGAVRECLPDSDDSTTTGTFGYMAPEQVRGSSTPVCDLYALGATLVHLLARVEPSAIPTRKLKLDFRQLVSVSKGFADWLAALLQPAPERRIASATVALARLRDLQHPRRLRRQALLGGAAGLLCLLASAAAFVAFGGDVHKTASSLTGTVAPSASSALDTLQSDLSQAAVAQAPAASWGTPFAQTTGGSREHRHQGAQMPSKEHVADLSDRAVPALEAALQDESPSVQMAALDALEKLSRHVPAAMKALVHALKNRNSGVRSTAARALGYRRGDAAFAKSALFAATRDESASVRSAAVEALGRVGLKKSEIGPLIRALQDPDRHVRRKAAYAVGRMGLEGKTAAAALERAFEADGYAFRAFTLGRRSAGPRYRDYSVKTLFP